MIEHKNYKDKEIEKINQWRLRLNLDPIIFLQLSLIQTKALMDKMFN
jgi:hypothetical protein